MTRPRNPDHEFSLHRPGGGPRPTAAPVTSWWLEHPTRDGFTRRAWAEYRDRMILSKFAATTTNPTLGDDTKR